MNCFRKYLSVIGQSWYNCGAVCCWCWHACVWCTQSLTPRKSTKSYSEVATSTSLVSDTTGQCVIILSDKCCVALPAATSLCDFVDSLVRGIFWCNEWAESNWQKRSCQKNVLAKFLYVCGINELQLIFLIVSHLISMPLRYRNLLLMCVKSLQCCTVSVLCVSFS